MSEPTVVPTTTRRSGLGWAIAGAVATTVGGGGLMLVLSLFWVVDCFDGDGGVPYVAVDSARHDVCHAAGGLVGLAIPLAWLAAGALVVLLLVRWARRRDATWLLVVAMVGPVALPLVVVAGLNAPSAECSEARDAANDRWRDDGQVGEQPYDCASY